jgi:hypothetical protein
MAVKALRAIRGGTIEHPGWEGWTLHHGRLYPPTGNMNYEPWELEQLEATFRRARAFADLYEQLNGVNRLNPPTVLRRVVLAANDEGSEDRTVVR